MNRIIGRIGLGRIKLGRIGLGGEIGMARLAAFARGCVGTPRRRQMSKRIGIAGGGVAALGLAIFAAMPAGAQTQPLQYVLPAQQAGVTLSIKAGPITYSGATFAVAGAQVGPFQARPRFATSVGHFAVAQLPTRPQQIVVPSGNAYGCPPWGSSSYSVPLYDYRADRYARRGYAYGYNYGYGYAQGVAAGQQAAAVATGAFNEPAGYTYVGLTETPRPTFQPLIVRIAGAPAKSGPMPVVHRPSGKNYIHIE